MRRVHPAMVSRLCLVGLLWSGIAFALDPGKALSQYSRTMWTQKSGLPQDAINAIVQTADGHLWLGTDEGLVRFNGYEFTVFDKDTAMLPSNMIRTLAAGRDGALWIGTNNGLVRYKDSEFRVYLARNGQSDTAVSKIFVDHTGGIWVVASAELYRMEGERMVPFLPAKSLPFNPAAVCEDSNNTLWVAGFSGLAHLQDGKFVPVVDSAALGGNLVTELVADRNDHLWMGGNQGVVERAPNGALRKFGTEQGLPHILVRSLLIDHNGQIWAGTYSGVARLEGSRFTGFASADAQDRNLVASVYEDREGNLWTGTVSGLTRFRDDVFTVYGRGEGLPGDDPTVLYQDRSGRVWVGFHDSGLMLMSKGKNRHYNTGDGLPSNEIFSVREARDGTVLIGTRRGLVRQHGNFSVFRPPDPLGRQFVFDSLEDSSGRLWLALPGGLGELRGNDLRIVIPGTVVQGTWFVTLMEAKDGALWAGTYARGLWRMQGEQREHFTVENGLSSNQIRALHQDRDGTVWIATMGGGLSAYRNGAFLRFTAKDGLLSDNIAYIVDDVDYLWLATPRGISRVAKQQLRDFSVHKIARLQPTNYGADDGLRSAQSSAGYLVVAGGGRTEDGRLWFPTSRGLAAIDPKMPLRARPTPIIQPLDFVADGQSVNLTQGAKLGLGKERIRIRYTAIYLAAPERVDYSYKLVGLDADWVRAGMRREIYYNSLPHGNYRFVVRAEVAGGPLAERDFSFEVLPEFYETLWFRALVGAILALAAWGAYRFRMRQLRYRFSLVLEERARIAREIHDTLAQGFVGISSQLEAVNATIPEDVVLARRYLDLARKMARHSLTEARRAVSDLRASMLEGHDLESALRLGTQIWTAGSGLEVNVEAIVDRAELPQEYEQHLLRITQEAVTNVLKHAKAKRVRVELNVNAKKVQLRIVDDGHGFDTKDGIFSTVGGHFGLIGMRERAERLGGELRLASHPGDGTEVEVTVPLP